MCLPSDADYLASTIGSRMLKRLLTTVLAKYKGLLWVVVVFQAIQAVAGLYLPTLNSDIINNGIVKEDLGYIWRIGKMMVNRPARHP